MNIFLSSSVFRLSERKTIPIVQRMADVGLDQAEWSVFSSQHEVAVRLKGNKLLISTESLKRRSFNYNIH